MTEKGRIISDHIDISANTNKYKYSHNNKKSSICI
jgi:hypothetical protein